MPYRKTYEALKEDNVEELYKLYMNSYSRMKVQQVFRHFGLIEDKKEKKYLLRAAVYLDFLLSFYKLPPSIG